MSVVRLNAGPMLRISRPLKRALSGASITHAQHVAEVLDESGAHALVLVVGEEVVLVGRKRVRRWGIGELACVEGTSILASDGTAVPILAWNYSAQRDALLAAVRSLLGQPAAQAPPAAAGAALSADPPADTSIVERLAGGGLVLLIIAVVVGTLGWWGGLGLDAVSVFAWYPLLILPALAIVIGPPVLVAATFPAGGSLKPLLAILAAACVAAAGIVALDAFQAHRKDERLLESTRTLAGFQGDKDGLHVAIREHAADDTVELILNLDPASASQYPALSKWSQLFCETPRTQVVFADPVAARISATGGVFPYQRASLHTEDESRPPESAHCYFHMPDTVTSEDTYVFVLLHRAP